MKAAYEVCERIEDAENKRVALRELTAVADRTAGDKWIKDHGEPKKQYVVVAIGPVRTVNVEQTEKRTLS